MKRFLSRSLYFVFALYLCGIAAGFESSYEERELFRSELAGFEVSFPKTWESNPLTKGKVFAIRNSDASKLGVISVSVFNAHNDVADVDKYMAFCKDVLPNQLLTELKERFGNGEVLEAKETVLCGHRAFSIFTSYKIHQPSFDISITALQVHCIRKGKGYIINFESPTASLEENTSAIQTILTTFNFR